MLATGHWTLDTQVSSVHISQHEVETAEDGDEVGDQHPFEEYGEHRHIRKRCGADLEPVRSHAALRDEVVAHLTFRVLGSHVDLAFGKLDHLRHLGDERTLRDTVDGGKDDLGRFANLVESHHVSVIGVSHLTGRNPEVEISVWQVVLGLAQVEFDAGGSEVRTGDTVGGRQFGTHHADAFGPGEQDLVAADQVVQFVAVSYYTSDAADDLLCVDLGGRRII